MEYKVLFSDKVGFLEIAFLIRQSGKDDRMPETPNMSTSHLEQAIKNP